MSKFGEWISVEDKMPENCKEVLVCVLRNTGFYQVKISHLNGAKTGFMVEYDDSQITPIESVTHWMPLPELPFTITKEDLVSVIKVYEQFLTLNLKYDLQNFRHYIDRELEELTINHF